MKMGKWIDDSLNAISSQVYDKHWNDRWDRDLIERSTQYDGMHRGIKYLVFVYDTPRWWKDYPMADYQLSNIWNVGPIAAGSFGYKVADAYDEDKIHDILAETIDYILNEDGCLEA